MRSSFLPSVQCGQKRPFQGQHNFESCAVNLQTGNQAVIGSEILSKKHQNQLEMAQNRPKKPWVMVEHETTDCKFTYPMSLITVPWIWRRHQGRCALGRRPPSKMAKNKARDRTWTCCFSQRTSPCMPRKRQHLKPFIAHAAGETSSPSMLPPQTLQSSMEHECPGPRKKVPVKKEIPL